MENKKYTYEEIIALLKNTSPKLEGSEELTQNILSNIERISAYKRKYKTLRFIELFSSVAAVVLFCTLVYNGLLLSIYPKDEITVSTKLVSKKATSTPVYELSSAKEEINEMIRKKQARKHKQQQIYSRLYYQKKHLTPLFIK
jgi:hypothetical protein